MSIVLNGSDQYAQRAGQVAGPAPFTVAVWFKSTSDSAFQAIWSEMYEDNMEDYWRLSCRGTVAGDPVGIYIRRVDVADAITSIGYIVNQWHHAIFVEASSIDHQVYIDGGSEGSDTDPAEPININRMAVGALGYNSGWTQFFAGKIAEVAIWSVALSASERADLIAGVDPSTIQPGNFEAYYPCEVDVDDYSGNDNHLTPVGSPSYDAVDVPTIFRHQYYDSGDNTYQSLAATNQWIAQTFTPTATHTCSRIRLKMFRANSPGILTVGIRATDVITGKPTGPDLASGTLNVNGIATGSSGEWYNIYLGAGTSLTSGTKYAIVCRCSAVDGSNTLSFRYDSSPGTYAGGNEEWSGTSGSSWTTLSNNDLMFEEWGDIPIIIAPTITDQSTSSTVLRGQETSLFITATGTPEPTYQWYLGGAEISGETNSTITVYPTATGTYTCIATNAGGSAESDPIVLTVVGNPYKYNPFNLPIDLDRTN